MDDMENTLDTTGNDLIISDIILPLLRFRILLLWFNGLSFQGRLSFFVQFILWHDNYPRQNKRLTDWHVYLCEYIIELLFCHK